MKKLAGMAYGNGVVVGANYTAALYNLIGAVGSAIAGDPLRTALSLGLTYLLAYVGWRTHKRHKAGMERLPD